MSPDLARLVERQLFLTVSEAARRLSVSRSHLYKLMDTGHIPYIQLGGVRRIPAYVLDLLIQASAEDMLERVQAQTAEEGEYER